MRFFAFGRLMMQLLALARRISLESVTTGDMFWSGNGDAVPFIRLQFTVSMKPVDA
jgi:hypothetical protein